MSSRATSRFIEHQMFNTFKEFQGDYHRHFKKYSDPEDAHANPPHILSQATLEDTQPLSGMRYMRLGKRPGYSKGLGWVPKPKARKMASASSSMFAVYGRAPITSCA
ncbi:CACTA en-spm transposon protein [Cucumis melo var. makuwa]|uniref:CACTA en-spm transposon protein n=1 Tax=Cucumis melo var. makuwa TaxID=1194695 RepID=A0A5D3DBT6_CUCMM|nr:CACTA en-spm transposon protein [Cucumis melo var. makuwa]TYK21033.1 CACTA en-spm transposon protein [Cucumis melo var. makuwa]